MKKLFLIFLLCSSGSATFAGVDKGTQSPDSLPAAVAPVFYYDWEFFDCFPEEEWRIILQERPDKNVENPDDPFRLKEKDFKKLTVRELISYYSHSEEFSQNCEGGEFDIPGMMGVKMYLEDTDYEGSNSTRQIDALMSNRDSVIYYIRECGTTHEHYCDMLKRVIIEIQGWELIPELLDSYEKQGVKEAYYLTTFIRLMMDAEFEPFKASQIYEYYNSISPVLPYNEKNESEILKLAEAYYKFKKKG